MEFSADRSPSATVDRLQTTTLHAPTIESETDRGAALEQLTESIERSSHLLPAQGPITVFIHHNTLHAFEELPFAEAVQQAAHVFGCHPYMSEEQYRDALRRGRIRFAELRQVLEQDLADRGSQQIPCFGTRLGLRLAMLHDPLRTGPSEELVWYVAEANALRRVRPETSAAARARLIAETRRWVMRDLRGGERGAGRLGNSRPADSRPGESGREAGVPQSLQDLLGRFGESSIESWSDDDWEGFALQALWRVCCDGVRDLPAFVAVPTPPIRHRDLLLEETGEDVDLLVHEFLIRFVGAFLDQGLAPAEMPLRAEGFYGAFCALYGQPAKLPDGWIRQLPSELRRLTNCRITPLESIHESLDLLGVRRNEQEPFLSATLLALRGWGGMLRQVELRGDRAVRPVPAGSLVEFLAVRLLLDRFSAVHVGRTAAEHTGPLSELRDWLIERRGRARPASVEQRAFLVFQLAQVAGLSPDVLHRLRRPEWSTIVREIEAFHALERRRIFHLAYECRFARQALDAIAIHAPQKRGRPARPAFQLACCLDEREESFRRHLEELAPGVETFGAAGFYSVAMYYRGAADAHFTPLCPVVVRPQHWVVEEVGDGLEAAHLRRAKTRRLLGAATRHVHLGSRTIASGSLLTGAVGLLATFPLVARILFPRAAGRIRKMLARIFSLRQPLASELNDARRSAARPTVM